MFLLFILDLGLLVYFVTSKQYNYNEDLKQYKTLNIMLAIVRGIVRSYIYGVLFYYGHVRKGFIVVINT